MKTYKEKLKAQIKNERAAAAVREQENCDLDYEQSKRVAIKESIASRKRGIALDKLMLATADALLQSHRARASAYDDDEEMEMLS
jgi:hypothetical protein